MFYSQHEGAVRLAPDVGIKHVLGLVGLADAGDARADGGGRQPLLEAGHGSQPRHLGLAEDLASLSRGEDGERQPVAPGLGDLASVDVPGQLVLPLLQRLPLPLEHLDVPLDILGVSVLFQIGVKFQQDTLHRLFNAL